MGSRKEMKVLVPCPTCSAKIAIPIVEKDLTTPPKAKGEQSITCFSCGMTLCAVKCKVDGARHFLENACCPGSDAHTDHRKYDVRI
jgi:hypothetical protein